MPEYVYLIGSEDSPIVKIGRSIDVPARLAAIQYMSPLKLAVLWQTEGGAELETALHRHFKAQRSHGEWFSFPGGNPVVRVRRAILTMRKMRKAQKVWRAPEGTPNRTPRTGSRMEPFLVGEVVLVTGDGWKPGETAVIRSISERSEHPFVVEENDGRHHKWLILLKQGQVAHQSAVAEKPRTEECGHIDCICASIKPTLTPDEHAYYYGGRPR